MILVNLVSTLVPAPPEKYKNSFSFVANCEVKERYANLASAALDAVIKYFEYNNIKIDIIIFVIFTKNGEFTIKRKSEAFGKAFRICLFEIDTWEAYEIDDLTIYASIIEEFLHILFSTDNEVTVKEKVREVIEFNGNPDITFRDIYKDRFNYDEKGNLIDDELLHK